MLTQDNVNVKLKSPRLVKLMFKNSVHISKKTEYHHYQYNTFDDSSRHHHSKDWGSMDLWNVVILPRQYTKSQPRRRIESPKSWKPQNSLVYLTRELRFSRRWIFKLWRRVEWRQRGPPNC